MINYYLLTKPGIIMGNLVTMFAGFWLASKGANLLALLIVALGLICIIGSACAFNNYIDRDLDKKMHRTKNRAIVKGIISGPKALGFAFSLAILGNIILLWTNPLTLILSNLGLFIYVFPYSLWKGDTIYGTAIGSLAGALPPVIGYTAAGGSLDFNALLLFLLLVLWQMPHFFSIAIYHFQDYSNAKIPVLPIVKGIPRANVHMIVYILALTATFLFLPLNLYFLLILVAIGFFWLAISIQGFQAEDQKKWGKKMFRYSLIMINALCLGIVLGA